MGCYSVNDRGKHFTQSTEQQITHKNWTNNRNSIYLSIMRNFEIKFQNKLYGLSITHKDEHLAKNLPYN